MPNPLHHARHLQELIAGFGIEAMTFTAKPKVEDTAHQWLARANLDPDDPSSADTIAQALMLALELAAGQIAGYQFEVRAGIAAGNAN